MRPSTGAEKEGLQGVPGKSTHTGSSRGAKSVEGLCMSHLAVMTTSVRNVVNALPLRPLILNRHRQYCESSGSAYSSAQPWQLLHSENPQGLSSTAQTNSKQKPLALIYIAKHKFRPKRFKAWRLRCSTQY
jgi:hypothetical protein